MVRGSSWRHLPNLTHKSSNFALRTECKDGIIHRRHSPNACPMGKVSSTSSRPLRRWHRSRMIPQEYPSQESCMEYTQSKLHRRRIHHCSLWDMAWSTGTQPPPSSFHSRNSPGHCTMCIHNNFGRLDIPSLTRQHMECRT